MEFLNLFLPTIQNFGAFAYWIVLLISLAESLAFIGSVIPGSVFVMFAGFLSAQGYLDFGDLIWFAALGAIFGDGISYYLGTKGTRFFRNENKILKLGYLEKGKQFLKKHGGKSIFLGRFIGPLRPIIPFVAGLSRVSKKTFLFWNIISGFLWAIFFLFLGYFFGGALNVIGVWSTRTGIFLLSLFLTVVIIWIAVKKSKPFFAFLRSIGISIKEAISSNSDIRHFIKNYPLFFKFLRNRLDKSRFSGLPLTLISVVFVYALSLFLEVIEDILTSDLIVAADVRIANLLAVFRDPQLTKVFLWITLLGKWQIIISSAVVLSLVFWLWRKQIFILFLWLAIAGHELFNSLGKLAFHRQRPEIALYTENSFSFPSGHAMIAVIFYGFLIYFLFRHAKKWGQKVNIFFIGLLIILAIGFSRLYLGVHFLSDVWGGYLLGLLWLIIVISILEQFVGSREKKVFTPSRTVKVIVVVLILTELVFYANFAMRYNPSFNIVQQSAGEVVTADILNLFTEKRLSKYTETLTGAHQEPLSFVILAKNDRQLVDTFQKASWFLAEPVTFISITKIAKKAFLNEQYLTAPMTPSFWNSVTHDFGFEKPTETDTVRERHHARIWRTNYEKDGYRIYVGTASMDKGIKWLITHTIKSDIDTEREFLIAELQNTQLVLDAQQIKFVEPALGTNFSGDQFFTDGKAYIIFLNNL